MKPSAIVTFTSIALFLLSLGAWLTHIITCIVREEWLLLLGGALMAPIGVVHGVGIWFGVW